MPDPRKFKGLARLKSGLLDTKGLRSGRSGDGPPSGPYCCRNSRGECVSSIDHDAFVAARFDASERRFKAEVASDDVRLRAVIESLGPLRGRRVLDLGCGKGRFASHLEDAGAEVVGLDLSAAMLAGAGEIRRVRASARRLPFADATFDAVIAIEVLEHVGVVEGVLGEARRVLKPGGRLAIVDKNAGALDSNRPWLPSLVVKWIDERRGLWMYPGDSPVRERWFWPRALRRRLRRHYEDVRVSYLLRPQEAGQRVFRVLPAARLMTLWSARVADASTTESLWGAGACPRLRKQEQAPALQTSRGDGRS